MYPLRGLSSNSTARKKRGSLRRRGSDIHQKAQAIWRIPLERGTAHAPSGKRRRIGKADIPFGPAIFALFCFLPLGVVALILAVRADNKLKAGDPEGATTDARVSQAASLLGLLLGLLVVFYIIMNK